MVIYIAADLDGDASFYLKIYNTSFASPVSLAMVQVVDSLWSVTTELIFTQHFCEVIDEDDNVWGAGWIDVNDNPISLKSEPPALNTKVEGGYSQAQLIRLHTAILAGLLSGVDPSEDVNTVIFKALNGVTTRVSANTDNVGNRATVNILNLD